MIDERQTERLHSFPPFAHFDAAQLALLAECATPLHFPRASSVYRAGDRSSDAYVIASGRVVVERETPYGRYVLAELERGDLLGEGGFFGQHSRVNDAVAHYDTDLLLLNHSALTTLAQRNQRFALALYWSLWKSLSQKLRTTNERLTRFFSETGKVPDALPPPRREQSGSFRIDMATKRGLFHEQRLANLEINYLASLSKERKYGPGEVIFRESDPGDRMFVVVEGRVMISKYIHGAGEEALAFLERGDYFGEMALIDHQPRSADAIAHSEGAVVLAIPGEVVEGILDIHKVSSLRLLKILCGMAAKRLREVDEKMIGWYMLAGGEGG